jgi:hypothetical protein
LAFGVALTRATFDLPSKGIDQFYRGSDQSTLPFPNTRKLSIQLSIRISVSFLSSCCSRNLTKLAVDSMVGTKPEQQQVGVVQWTGSGGHTAPSLTGTVLDLGIYRDRKLNVPHQVILIFTSPADPTAAG